MSLPGWLRRVSFRFTGVFRIDNHAIFIYPFPMKTSIIIPAYNEAETIEPVLRTVSELPIDKEIIVVDNGSTDDSADIIKRVAREIGGIAVVSNPSNIGKGHGVRLGMQRASGDIIAFQDADLELDPRDLIPLVELIVDGKADVAFGKRFGGHNHLKPSATVVANYCLSFLASILLRRRIRDIESCYKVFKRELIFLDSLKSDRFEIDIEVAFALLSQPGVRYAEWPIRYQPRNYSEGKKIRIKDGLQAIWIMLVCRFGVYRNRRNTGARKKAN